MMLVSNRGAANMSRLTFKLKAKNNDPVELSDFGDFSKCLADVIKRIHRARHRDGAPLDLRITELAVGSAICTVSSNSDSLFSDTEQVLNSIRFLERPKLGITTDDLRAIKKLHRPLENKTQMIMVADTPIDERLARGCDYLIAHIPRSLGQVIGKLDGLNIHKANFFRIYPEGSNRGAKGFFPDSKYDAVYKCLGKRVRVEGMIHRDPDDRGIDQITNVTHIEEIAEEDSLPGFQQLIGLFADDPIDFSAGWRK